MPRRKPRIISKDVDGSAARHIPVASALHPYEPPPKTEADKLYDLIFNESVKGYRFTDEELGEPWIRREDIEDKGGDLYVIRFRCPPNMTHEVHFGSMAADVCKAMNCMVHLVHHLKMEYKIPFEDCIWVIQKNELKEIEEAKEAEDDCYDAEESDIDNFEEIEGDLNDDSTAEEIDERFEKTLEDFV